MGRVFEKTLKFATYIFTEWNSKHHLLIVAKGNMSHYMWGIIITSIGYYWKGYQIDLKIGNIYCKNQLQKTSGFLSSFSGALNSLSKVISNTLNFLESTGIDWTWDRNLQHHGWSPYHWSFYYTRSGKMGCCNRLRLLMALILLVFSDLRGDNCMRLAHRP